MKSKMLILVLCFMLLFNFKVFAVTGPEIEAIVTGTVEKGETIQILINIKDIPSFFAGSMEFKYDKNILKVKSIELGDLISKPDVNKFDAMNKIDDTKGIATYGFSCLGKVNGFSGTGTFVKINAEVLKKDSFHVRSKAFLKEPNDDFNLKLQICDSNIKELEYNFKPYEFNLNGTTGTNGDTNNSTSTTSNNTGGSTENTSTENSSGASNTNTSTNTSSSQNSTSKDTPPEEKNDKTFIQKIISSVTSVFNGDKKEDSKKTETTNKTENTNKKTETQNKTGDSNKTTEDTNKKADDENKSSAKINSATSKEANNNSSKVALILVLVILLGIAVGVYLAYKKKNKM